MKILRPLALLTLSGVALAACGNGPRFDGVASGNGDAADDTGTIAVSLEPVDGIFTEGFEVGLRFETATGEVLGTTLWSDFVQAQSAEPTMDDHYDSVLEQAVPAGDVVVLASVALGMGPGPVAPDVDGPLDCRLDVTVPAGETVAVEVSFDSSTGNCLTLL
jgi:hypothetical protein